MPSVILVRHGETDWNRRRIFRGRTDMPLNKLGMQQGQAVANALEGTGVDAVVTGPLSRALETARPIAGSHGLELEVDAAFNDIHYGELEGTSDDDFKDRFPDLHRAWTETPHRVRFPGGEDLEAVRSRALARVQELASIPGRGVTVVVTHRVVIKVLVMGMLGWGLEHFWDLVFTNGSISELQQEDGAWRPLRLNDMEHLGNVGALDDDF